VKNNLKQFLPICYYWLKKYHIHDQEKNDLIQDFYVICLESIEKYDENKSTLEKYIDLNWKNYIRKWIIKHRVNGIACDSLTVKKYNLHTIPLPDQYDTINDNQPMPYDDLIKQDDQNEINKKYQDLLKKLHKKLTKTEVQILVDLYSNGLKIRQISKKYNVSTTKIYAAINKIKDIGNDKQRTKKRI